MSLLHRHKGLTPYLLLLPGIAWLVLFFLAPLGFLGYQSLQTGTFDTGYTFDWAFSNYWDAIRDYHVQFVRSFVYAGIATILALLVAYPLVYWIAFRAGRWKNVFLILIVAPLFVTYLVRTLAWLNRFRRLTIRYERRLDIHQAFLQLGCALICHNYLIKRFC